MLIGAKSCSTVLMEWLIHLLHNPVNMLSSMCLAANTLEYHSSVLSVSPTKLLTGLRGLFALLKRYPQITPKYFILFHFSFLL